MRGKPSATNEEDLSGRRRRVVGFFSFFFSQIHLVLHLGLLQTIKGKQLLFYCFGTNKILPFYFEFSLIILRVSLVLNMDKTLIVKSTLSNRPSLMNRNYEDVFKFLVPNTRLRWHFQVTWGKVQEKLLLKGFFFATLKVTAFFHSNCQQHLKGHTLAL